jgi:hypothetical protein
MLPSKGRIEQGRQVEYAPSMRPVIALIAGALLATGCFPSGSGGFRITEPKPAFTSPAPPRDTPGNLLRLLEWCFVNRDTATYQTLFTEDFRFVFSPLDPDGNAYRTNPWTREDELISFGHLVNGGDANQPAATSITLGFDRNFRQTENPSHPGIAHALIRTGVTLKILTDQEREIVGYTNFFFVRGDSASIPPDLIARGFRPDSTQWWIQRWEDDTFQEEGLMRAMPAQKATWGSLKALYR